LVLPHPSVPVAPAGPVEEFNPPEGLSVDALAVWKQQAPHAFRNRTLSPASALAFERYCTIVVLERNEARSSGVGGANHRGLLKQINLYELQFLLSPNGRPIPEPAASSVTPQSRLAKFRA
jgi:hypothetical protein